MHVIVERDALAPALDAVSKVAGKANVIPILANVLLQAEAGTLRISASNLDVWMTLSILAEVKKRAAITVPADALRTIVRGVSAGAQISLALKGDRLEMKAGRSTYRLGTLPAADFPHMEAEPQGRCGTIDLSGADAKALLERPAFATSKDETRIFLQGVFLHVADGRLRSVATDGKRLFGSSIPAPPGAESMPMHDAYPGAYPGVILPAFALDGIVRALEGGGKLTVDGHKFIATGNRMSFSGKLIDGIFPDYSRAVPPRQTACRAVMDRVEMMEATRRLAVVAGKANQNILVSWREGEEEARLSGTNIDKGEGEEFVRLREPAAGNYAREWRAEYLTQQAAALSGEFVELAHDIAQMGAWVADPNDADTLSIAAPMAPKSAEAVDDAA